jgi:ribosomal protein S18 acetylase RimI-like enzyme
MRRAAPEVRAIVRSDLPRIAELHVEAFPDSVLGRLGSEAVRRNYEWQLDGPHELTALAGLSDGELCGFLFGGVFRGSTIGFVKREKWFLASQVIRHPSVLAGRLGRGRVKLALRLLTRRWSAPAPEDPASVPRRSFGVLAVAVDPHAQGRGVGRALMDVASDHACAAGFESMHLSVHPGNTQAVAFYRSLGWVELRGDDGTWTGRMTRQLLQR